MGDRANIVIRESHRDDLDRHEAVFLYGHWSGHDLPEILRAALDRGRDRWSDPEYLARIVFQTMIGDDAGLTGFGISTRLTDNEYPLLVLHLQRVYRLEESEYHAHGFSAISACPSVPFSEVADAPGGLTWNALGEMWEAVTA